MLIKAQDITPKSVEKAVRKVRCALILLNILNKWFKHFIKFLYEAGSGGSTIYSPNFFIFLFYWWTIFFLQHLFLFGHVFHLEIVPVHMQIFPPQIIVHNLTKINILYLKIFACNKYNQIMIILFFLERQLKIEKENRILGDKIDRIVKKGPVRNINLFVEYFIRPLLNWIKYL